MKKILLVVAVLAVGYFAYTQLAPANKGGDKLKFDDTSGPVMDTSTKDASASVETIYTPKDVVTMFTRATLGTIPGSLVDYDLAKTLMTRQLAGQWIEDSFVSVLYGIQQGPDKLEFIDDSASGDTATVRVWGYYGEDVGRDWTFTLKKVDAEWLIDAVEVAEPTDAQ